MGRPHAFRISVADFLYSLTLFIGINIMAAPTYSEVVRKGKTLPSLRGENLVRRDLRGKWFPIRYTEEKLSSHFYAFSSRINLFHLRTRDATYQDKKSLPTCITNSKDSCDNDSSQCQVLLSEFIHLIPRKKHAPFSWFDSFSIFRFLLKISFHKLRNVLKIETNWKNFFFLRLEKVILHSKFQVSGYMLDKNVESNWHLYIKLWMWLWISLPITIIRRRIHNHIYNFVCM